MTGEEHTKKPVVFVSYSHQDADWKDRLKIQLKVLEQLGKLEVWDDRKIDPGGAWYEAIGEVMASAKAAICLISAPYLASDFCVKEEIPYLLQQMEEQGLILVPVLIRPCPWSEVPWLKRLQMIPRDGVTVASLEANEQDQVFSDLASKLNTMLRMAAEERQLAVSRDSEIGPKAGLATGHPALADQFIDIERLPVTGAELFGRQAELKMLDEAWESETTNIVSLVAWGGVGKSTLLNKWVKGFTADNYRGAGRVFAWSFYSQGTSERVTSADEFVSEALKFFGDDDPSAGSPWAKGERLAELVGREKALLLLDGMEPLQDQYQGIKDPALSRLIECLAVRNDGLCVITTREPVKELSNFTETSLQKNLEFLSPEAGRALLRVKGVRGSDAELEAASAAFGNHALAINLLASFLRDCEGRHIRHAAEIPDLADLDDPNHRHPRRVMAAFAGLFGEGPELDLLHMMGLFDRPADAGCIAALRREPAVSGLTEELSKLDEAGWLKLLEKLRDFGLLAEASHHDPDELDAHPLVREHFGAELQAQREEAWKAGHERLYEHLQSVPDKYQPDTLAEMAPLFQAIHHGCKAKRFKHAFQKIYTRRIQRGIHTYHGTHVLGTLGSDLAALSGFFEPNWSDKPPDVDESDDPDALRLHNQVGYRLLALGRLEEAILVNQKSYDEHRAAGDQNWQAMDLANLADVRLLFGDIRTAISNAHEILQIAEGDVDRHVLFSGRLRLARALHAYGEFHEAISFLEKEFYEDPRCEKYTHFKMSNPRRLSGRTHEHSELLVDIGDTERAREICQPLFELRKTDIGSNHDQAFDALTEGMLALKSQELNEAKKQLPYALLKSRSAGRVEILLKCLLLNACLSTYSADYKASKVHLDEASRIAKRCSMRLYECNAHLEYARLALAQGNTADALSHLKSAKALVSACGYHRRDREVAELEAVLS